MKIGKTLVFVNGVLFVGFGLGFIISPGFFLKLFTETTLSLSSAVIDVRATYGGLGLGVGVWLLLCFKDNVRLGLLGSLVVLASIILGRTIGLIVDGNPNIFMFVFLGAEMVFFLAALYALKSTKI